MKITSMDKEIVYSVGMIVVPLVLLFIAVIVTKPMAEPVAEEMVVEEVKEKSSVFETINIEARGVVVKDLNNGEIIYSKNPNLPLPLASVTKVLTALTAEMSSDKKVLGISISDLSTEGDSLLFPGELFYKKDLVDFTLIASSNDGASALAANTFSAMGSDKADFITKMNQVARQIGMTDSYFFNETGLDNSDITAGAHGSAEDIAALFEYVLVNYPQLLEATKDGYLSVRSINGYIHNATNTNDIAGELPNLVASKTGFTDIAGGNLAVVIDPGLNRPIAIVVLGSSEEGRFNDVRLLSQKITEYFK